MKHRWEMYTGQASLSVKLTLSAPFLWHRMAIPGAPAVQLTKKQIAQQKREASQPIVGKARGEDPTVTVVEKKAVSRSRNEEKRELTVALVPSRKSRKTTDPTRRLMIASRTLCVHKLTLCSSSR